METARIADLTRELGTLDDLVLWERTRGAARSEQWSTGVVIAHIAEVRKRELFLVHACTSLYDY